MSRAFVCLLVTMPVQLALSRGFEIVHTIESIYVDTSPHLLLVVDSVAALTWFYWLVEVTCIAHLVFCSYADKAL